jgi:hypothetical protein
MRYSISEDITYSFDDCVASLPLVEGVAETCVDRYDVS